MNDTNNSELGAQENIPSTDSDRPASNSVEGHPRAEKLDVTGPDSIGVVDKQIAAFLDDGFLDDSELTALDSHLDGYYDHPPPDTRAENVKHLRTSVVKRTELEATKGPIPPPKLLAGYGTPCLMIGGHYRIVGYLLFKVPIAIGKSVEDMSTVLGRDVVLVTVFIRAHTERKSAEFKADTSG
jgi:hypothetical protein